jgi:hypothetical protein
MGRLVSFPNSVSKRTVFPMWCQYDVRSERCKPLLFGERAEELAGHQNTQIRSPGIKVRTTMPSRNARIVAQ